MQHEDAIEFDLEAETEAEPDDFFELTAEEVGERLDRVCQGRIEGISRARVQAWIADGHIRVNGAATKAGHALRRTDKVEIVPPPIEPATVTPENIPLRILYEDADVLVVDKPQGMVVHPAPGNPSGTLVNALLYHCKDLSGVGGVARPGIVHRLDKETSGLLMVAKNDAAHQALAGQIQAKTALRQYWAVIAGHLDPYEGRISAAIGRHPTQRQRMAIVHGARAAATRWKTLELWKGYSLVELTLETGRTHQIRVHLTQLGHPVVGDTVYGGDQRLPIKLSGQALHARRLSFDHPRTGERITLEAEPPEPFRKLLNYLRLQTPGGGVAPSLPETEPTA